MAADDLKNVRTSIEKHFETQLGGVSSVHWDGIPFDTDAVTEWLEPRVTGPVSTPSRSGERIEVWTLSTNCYAKLGRTAAGAQQENRNRHWELAGEVRAVFHQATIAVQDWDAGGDPTIGYLRFREANANQIEDAGKGKSSLAQVNVTIEADLIF